ncbi:MAG: 4Fe-4S dicluster domain-containing protein [Bacteroidetes bacterium]|jgi:ferredoxin|nr:4Fe-4S dicluster domain-containing protein [Bacteroidota bacterium]
MVTIQRNDLQTLFDALERRGYRIISPTVRDEAIILDTVHSADDLPKGRGEEQSAARYRLNRREDDALFGYAVGPHAWKQFLYPPVQTLLQARREGTSRSSGEPGFALLNPEGADEEPAMAFVGVRPCDLAAIRRLDAVFLQGPFQEPGYARRRSRALVVVAQCTAPSGTCFCASMNTGPSAPDGFDIALTEVLSTGPTVYLAESGSERGAEILRDVTCRPSTSEEISAAARAIESAAGRMGRHVDLDGLSETLRRSIEHVRWQQTAQRCLSCANCTMVCPTCFCSTVEDTTDLTATIAERRRRWDSCFTLDYSYIHGGSVRPSGMSRYRQWIMHKMSTWVDQYGTYGCTGCGRCITWCPVGIDITQEVAAVQHPSIESVTPPRENVHG